MALVYLEPLPPRTTKGELIHFLNEVGGVERRRIGRIDLKGNSAVVEVPDGSEARLVQSLDGALLKSRRLRCRAEAPAAAPGTEDHFQRLARLLELESQ